MKTNTIVTTLKIFLGTTCIAIMFGGTYLAWNTAKQLSTDFTTLQDSLNSQRSELNRQQFYLLNAMLKMEHEKTERELHNVLDHVDIASLINKIQLNRNNKVLLESWLKGVQADLTLTQISIFNLKGDVIADVTTNGYSGLIESNRIKNEYSQFIQQTSDKNGSRLYDLFTSNKDQQHALHSIFTLPITNSNKRKIAILGATQLVNRGKILADYHRFFGKNAPIPFIKLNDEQAVKTPLIYAPIKNHLNKPIALTGIRQYKNEPNPLLSIKTELDGIQDINNKTLIALLISLALFIISFMSTGNRREKRKNLKQNARKLLKEKSRISWKHIIDIPLKRFDKPTITLVVKSYRNHAEIDMGAEGKRKKIYSISRTNNKPAPKPGHKPKPDSEIKQPDQQPNQYPLIFDLNL